MSNGVESITSYQEEWEMKIGYEPISDKPSTKLPDQATKRETRWTRMLFLATFVLVTIYLANCGSMAEGSMDSESIWQAIKSFYSEERIPSYVMYKGFSSIFPYVWLYQLSQAFHTNEFFFVMLYHALLFSYITAYGVPALVEELTDYKPRFWQKVLATVVFFWYWERYHAIRRIYVDLPSCAFFMISVHCAISARDVCGWKQYALRLVSALFAGLCANISGQYSVAALVVIIYLMIQIWTSPTENRAERDNRRQALVQMFLVLLLMYVPRQLNVLFNAKVVAPLVAEGAWIPSGKIWMERAFVNGLPNLRILYGNTLRDARGEAILLKMYGEERGRQIMAAAAAGGYSWSVFDYFQAVFSQPSNFIMLYVNTFMCMLSDDGGQGSILILLPGYIMVYLTLYTTVNRTKSWKNVINMKSLLVIAALSSVLALFVSTNIEMRLLLTLQCLLFGTALLGPILPQIATGISNLAQSIKTEHTLLEMRVPWAVVGGAAFCLFCMAYFGALCGNSDLGINMLYHW